MFYGVRLGHVPGVYTSWKEAQPQTIGVRSDFKRFKTRQKAEAYVSQPVSLGQTPLSSPDAVFYTDGSVRLARIRDRRMGSVPDSCRRLPYLPLGTSPH